MPVAGASGNEVEMNENNAQPGHKRRRIRVAAEPTFGTGGRFYSRQESPFGNNPHQNNPRPRREFTHDGVERPQGGYSKNFGLDNYFDDRYDREDRPFRSNTTEGYEQRKERYENAVREQYRQQSNYGYDSSEGDVASDAYGAPMAERREYGHDNYAGGRPDYNNRNNYRPQRGYNQQRGYGQQRGGYDNPRGGGYGPQRGGYDNQQRGYGPQRGGYDNPRGGGYGPQRGGYDNQQRGYGPQRGGYGMQRPYEPRRNDGMRNPEGGQRDYGNRGGMQRGGGYNRPYGQHAPQQNKRFNRPGGGFKKNPRPRQPIQPVKYQEVVTDPNEEIRLNKFLANAGVCSRREADELIQKGLVTVNGEVVTELGSRVTRQDEVIYNGNPVKIESKVYVLLNKPRNCVTTSDDPECRTTVMDIVRNACPERIYPVGRLDRNTTGVLLVTNDGDLAAKLTHPSFMKKKIYHVWLDKGIPVEDMQRIAEGIELEDGEIHADAISYVKDDDDKQVGIEIHSGRNRIVRRIFEHLGYHVIKLDRVYFAGLTKKNLPRGKWRYLNEQEVNNLRMGAFD